jgi:hypothetical protein
MVIGDESDWRWARPLSFDQKSRSIEIHGRLQPLPDFTQGLRR